MLAFVVSAACAGLGGAVLALVVRLAAPSGFTLVLSLGCSRPSSLGGLGSLVGALLGGALLVFLPTVVTDLGVGAGLDDIRPPSSRRSSTAWSRARDAARAVGGAVAARWQHRLCEPNAAHCSTGAGTTSTRRTR